MDRTPARPLADRRVGVLVADDGVEHVELSLLVDVVEQAGGRAELLTPDVGPVHTRRGLVAGPVVDARLSVADVRPEDLDALAVPGGLVGVDRLRTCREAVDLVRGTVRWGHPVAVLGHATWLLVEADVLRGRTVTGRPSVATDVRNAGGTWSDGPVAICDEGPAPIVSGRGTGIVAGRRLERLGDDEEGTLGAFRAAVLGELAGGRTPATAWALDDPPREGAAG